MRSGKKNEAAALGEKLLAVLEAQRALGKDAYPLTLQRLAELVAPEQIGEAIGAKPFKDGAVAANTKDPAGLVALARDVEQLASDPRLLEWALDPLCTTEKAIWPLAKVKMRIENTKLRGAFEAAVGSQARENRLPAAVGYRLEKRNKALLFLRRIPPKDQDEVLAEKLLHALEAQRRLGGDAYPLSRKRLVELTDPKAKATLVNKALSHPILRDKLLLIDPTNPQAPLGVSEDQAQLLSSRALPEWLLRGKHKPKENAFPVEGLVSKKSAFYRPVLDAINRQIDADSLPPTLGWMWIGKKKQLFFLDDIHKGRPTEAPVAAPPPRESPADFAAAFDAAFNQIDRRSGAHNFVSLVDMRKALPLPPADFNAELRKLRVAGRYTLAAAEGRHGVTAEDQTAGIVEDGSLLLYVSRKAP